MPLEGDYSTLLTVEKTLHNEVTMHHAADLSSSSKNLKFEEVYLGLEEETGNFYKGCCAA